MSDGALLHQRRPKAPPHQGKSRSTADNAAADDGDVETS